MKLIIEDDEGRKTVVPIVREEMEITIGRQEGNTIRLTERNVSRKHAKISRRNGSVFVEDIGSSYGTRVNGDKIQGRQQIKEGDLIQIGDYDLAIQNDAGRAASASVDALAPTVREMPAIPDPSEEADFESDPSRPARPPSKSQQTAVISGAHLRNLRPNRQIVDIPETEAPRLVLLTTENAGREYACIRSELKIGRTDDNDIPLDHRSLSRNHCKLIREEDGTWRILDLQSANGVKVNGEQYADSLLHYGDVLELGHVKFKFVAPGEDLALDGARGGSTGALAGSKGGLSKGVLIGGGIGALVLLGGGGYLLTRPDSPAPVPVTTAPSELAGTAEPAKAPPADTPAPTEVEPEETVDPAARAALEAGVKLLAQGKFEQAEQELLRADAAGLDEAAPELARAREGIASTELLEDAREKLAAGDLEGARASLEQIPEESVIAREVTKVHEALAKAEAKQAREQEALAAQAAAEEERRLKAEAERAAREERARLAAETKSGRDTTRVAAAGQAKKAAPQAVSAADKAQAEADMITGKELMKKQKLREAVVFFEKALAADPSQAEAHLFLGSCYATMQELDRAAEHYEKFVRMRPDHQHAPMVRDNLRKYYEQYGGN